MKYTRETIDALENALEAHGSIWHTAEELVGMAIDALESTEEQKALRADAERHRWLTGGGFSKDSYGIYWRRTFSRLCHEWDDGYARKLEEAIDKARGA